MFQNNTCLDILAVAAAMMRGEMEYRKGNYDAAFAHLRRSVELEDGLPYDEPWAWMQPTRHASGRCCWNRVMSRRLKRSTAPTSAWTTRLPRACQHPENVWSLHGYHECLMRLGKHDLAAMVKQRLDLAPARADSPDPGSLRLPAGVPAA